VFLEGFLSISHVEWIRNAACLGKNYITFNVVAYFRLLNNSSEYDSSLLYVHDV